MLCKGGDMGENQDTAGNIARGIVLAVLAFLALGVALPGAIVYLNVVDAWADGPRGFHGIEGAVDWIFGVIAAVAIAAGLAVAGIILRLLRWRRAPLAGLCLAVLGAGFIIVTYLIFSDTGTTPDSIEVVFLQVASLILLVIVALPPFLHWAMARPEPLAAPKESGS